MRKLVFLLDLSCFASFGWAMLRHFRRGGPPKLALALTAGSVPVFATVNLAAVLTRPLACPAAALVLYTGSLTLFWSTVAATRGRNLSPCFQGQLPAAVVCTGPYRLIRHPFYTSYILTWAGGFAATLWWPTAAITVIMAGVYCGAARQEERSFLRSNLGEVYGRFMRVTGRFLPRLMRHGTGPEAGNPASDN
jgi:protein-S-isoprenylcysteine O-methyltransferase Ste14